MKKWILPIVLAAFFIWIGWGCGNPETLANDTGQGIRNVMNKVTGY